MLGKDLPAIGITILANLDKFSAGMDKVENELNRLEKTGASSMQKFGTVLKVGLGVATGALAAVVGKSLKEAVSAETVMFDLENSIKNLGQSVAEVKPKVEAMGNAMVNLGFDDEDAFKAFTKLNTATKDSGKALGAMGLVADVARKKHIDLASASTLVARATTGSSRLFTEFGIKLDQSIKDPAERTNKAFAELQKRIGGTAEAFGQTAEGQMQAFGQEMDNLYQAVGVAFLPALKVVVQWLRTFAEWAQKNSDLLVKGLLIGIGLVTAGWIAMAIANAVANWEIYLTVAGILALAAAFVYLWNKSELFRKVVIAWLQNQANAIQFVSKLTINYFQMIFNRLDKQLGYFAAIARLFKQDDLANAMDRAGDKLRNISDKFQVAENKVDSFFNKIKKELPKWQNKKIELPIDIEKFKSDLQSGWDAVSNLASGESAGVTDTSGSTKSTDKFIQRIQIYTDKLNLFKETIAGNLDAMKETADRVMAQAAIWLRQANALEKATRGTDKHEKALKRLSAALNFATDAQRYQNQVAEEAQKQANDTSRAINEMANSYARANSYLASQSRVSGFESASTMIEVPVIVDGQVLFRVSQKHSLLNNRRNATNGLSVSNQVI